MPPRLALPDSRRDEREDGRRGVVGREMGLREAEVERWMLLPAWGVVEVAMFPGAGLSLLSLSILVSESKYATRCYQTGLVRYPCKPPPYSRARRFGTTELRSINGTNDDDESLKGPSRIPYQETTRDLHCCDGMLGTSYSHSLFVYYSIHMTVYPFFVDC